ncbi:MAG TPA: beta-propeller fold lactonase family protein, partial [Candidatus Nitrosocosmicus sp.]|nr:beta-propeller fold lactonase family protein [Candidatus Nitrosocosmicus sp.]
KTDTDKTDTDKTDTDKTDTDKTDTDKTETDKTIQENENPDPIDGQIHNVTIEAKKLQNGQYGYIMKKHILLEDGFEKDLTYRYPNYPTIPGPTIELYEGDLLILTSKDSNGNIKTQNIQPKQSGTFEYFGENFRTLGLFGAIIVDSYDKIPSKVDGKVVEVDPKDLEKQYVLFMVGSTFWGQEIDSKHIQKPLWTNPELGADLNQLVRFHILGAANQHTFHLHAHEWVDPGTANIIDTILITPNQGTSFIVQAGDRAGIGNWHYHCHVFAHMEAGMKGSFKVGPVGSHTESIPGPSPLEKGPTGHGNFITFSITDEPGKFFKNLGGELLEGATESLGVVKQGGTAHFIMDDTNTVHTITSLLWPSEAENMPINTINGHNKHETTQQENKSLDFTQSQIVMPPHMPFDQVTAYSGGGIVKLEAPGLYVFTCKVHPYMFGGVIADNPETEDALDLGNELELSTGEKIPSSHPLSLALLKTFFVANNPSNWLDYSNDNPKWKPTFPHIPVKTDLGEGYLDEALLKSIGSSSIQLDQIVNPSKPGLGEVWVDTQFEETASKTKPGTVTKVNTENWQVERKVSLPQINMNNPHNMWSDSSQQIIYQTQWFDNRLTAFDRNTGNLLDDMRVGDAPSHIMTNPDNDLLYVSLSGEQGVAEVKFDKNENKFKKIRIIPTQDSAQNPTHPHGHWITPDGNKMITSNHFTDDTTIFDFTQNLGKGEIKSRVDAGNMPIAIGMMPDGKRAYVSNLLSNNINIIDMELGRVIKTIDLGAAGHALPIQTPVSPNGQYLVTANTLTGTIAIIDTNTNEVVKSLPCDPGCHGVNFGAKKDGGYYAYVTSKFSNRMIVVDGDPNNNGNPEDAVIAGTVLLTGSYNNSGNSQFENDDNMTTSNVKLKGMGGQGVYAIPNVYPGWVQLLDLTWGGQLTDDQRDPIGTFNALKNDIIVNQDNNPNLGKDLKSLNSQDNITEIVKAEKHNLDQETQILDIENGDTQIQKEDTQIQKEDPSSEITISNSMEKPNLHSIQPNNILAMLPIPYP